VEKALTDVTCRCQGAGEMSEFSNQGEKTLSTHEGGEVRTLLSRGEGEKIKYQNGRDCLNAWGVEWGILPEGGGRQGRPGSFNSRPWN